MVTYTERISRIWDRATVKEAEARYETILEDLLTDELAGVMSRTAASELRRAARDEFNAHVPVIAIGN